MHGESKQTEDGEEIFRKAMTRKARPQDARPQRSWSETPRSGPSSARDIDTPRTARVAGGYTRRQAEGANPVVRIPEGGTDMFKRSDVSFVLSPSEQDPPHPHHILQNQYMTKGHKAKGAYSGTLSEQSARMAVSKDQSNFRFEVLSYDGAACRTMYRALSSPPPHTSSYRNPITGECEVPMSTPRRGRATNESHKKLLVSHQVQSLTDHVSLDEEALKDRSNRLATDKHFANMCEVSSTLGRTTHTEAGKIKMFKGRDLSHNVANALRWDA